MHLSTRRFATMMEAAGLPILPFFRGEATTAGTPSLLSWVLTHPAVSPRSRRRKVGILCALKRSSGWRYESTKVLTQTDVRHEPLSPPPSTAQLSAYWSPTHTPINPIIYTYLPLFISYKFKYTEVITRGYSYSNNKGTRLSPWSLFTHAPDEHSWTNLHVHSFQKLTH